MVNRRLFLCGPALFVALNLVGCGGGGIKEGMPAETAPSQDLMKQNEEAGRMATEALQKKAK